MNSDEKTIDQFQELLSTLNDALDMHMDDAIQAQGIEAVCPHCVAKEMLDENRTAFISDIFAAGKDDPTLFSAAVVKALYSVSAVQLVLQEMLKEMVELFRDELGDEDDNE